MCVGRIKKLAAELKVCTTERWVVRKLTAFHFRFEYFLASHFAPAGVLLEQIRHGNRREIVFFAELASLSCFTSSGRTNQQNYHFAICEHRAGRKRAECDQRNHSFHFSSPMPDDKISHSSGS